MEKIINVNLVDGKKNFTLTQKDCDIIGNALYDFWCNNENKYSEEILDHIFYGILANFQDILLETNYLQRARS